MVRIAISQSAFDAIAKTLPLGSMGYENKVNEKGERLIWLDRAVVDRLRHLRGPGESYSDVRLDDPPAADQSAVRRSLHAEASKSFGNRARL
jgi:hypothetical protein